MTNVAESTLNRRQFLSVAAAAGLGSTVLRPGAGGAEASPGAAIARRYEHVFLDGRIAVHDMDAMHALVDVIPLKPEVAFIKGVCFSPVTRQLYLSYRGPQPVPTDSHGYLMRYDLAKRTTMWTRTFERGRVDSMAITPDGRRLYVPAGTVQNESTACHVVNALTRKLIVNIAIAPHPHNTVAALDGSAVYVGAIGSNYLHVLDPATNRRVARVGPFGVGGPVGGGGVRPFTVNGRHTRAFVNVNGLLGFEVADLVGRASMFRVDLREWGVHWPVSARGPSHGISLAPDEREVYVLDRVNDQVHVFDVRGVTAKQPVAPQFLASISLQGSFTGTRTGGQPKEGWLQHSLDGRLVYVGDAGDVLDTATRTSVQRLADTVGDTSKFLEIDYDIEGNPVATSSRIGLGYVTG